MSMRLNNEFALVELTVDHHANGERLRITSMRTGFSRSLDPLMLEVLTWLPIEHLIAALDTPFGPEPDLGVVRAPNDLSLLHHDTGSADGTTEAGLR
jgi:hypothetical protein